MPCGVHFTYHPNCPPCRDVEGRADARDRHKQQMRQAERHHRERMRAQNGGGGYSPPPVLGLGMGISKGWLIVTGLVLAGLIGLALVVTLLTAAISIVTLAIQGVFAFAFFGGIAGAITFAIQRYKTPGAQLRYARPDTTLSVKDRAVVTYRSLDPVSRSAVKVGGIVGAAALALSVVF